MGKVTKLNKRVSPFKELGGSGTFIYGGFVETIERDPRLSGGNRHKTINDMVVNTSIVAAGTRYFLNLLAKPEWTLEPADESTEAQDLAEWAEEALYDCQTSWYRIVRKAGLFIFHGFGIQEWTAKRGDEGRIVFDDIEARPVHTITRWDVDDRGTVQGMYQRPYTGVEVLLPREKVLYIVDDSLTDSPEGLGIFRHLVAPAETMKRYRELELMCFERDMRGIPVGRAPFAMLNQMLKEGKIDQSTYDQALEGIRNFVKMQAKGKATGVLIDSDTYEIQGADGNSPSSVMKWGLDLLSGATNGSTDIANALDKLTHDMARLIGVEGLLLGSNSQGSFALSKDKSNNLYLNIHATLRCIVEAVDRDLIGPLWMMNGLDPALKPYCKTEDVAFKDAASITAALRDMATAGAVLAPDDPAIDEVRDILGISPSIPYDASQQTAIVGPGDPNNEDVIGNEGNVNK